MESSLEMESPESTSVSSVIHMCFYVITETSQMGVSDSRWKRNFLRAVQ